MPAYLYQTRLHEAILQGKSIILQAPTGAGKTRGALTPFIKAFYDLPVAQFPHRCLYAVPMRILATQFTHEYRKCAEAYWDTTRRREMRVRIQTGEYGQDKELMADLTFATIDQLLSSWLLHPYSLSRRKGNINAGALVGQYLVFDEFHLFDPDSTLPTTLHMLKMLKGVSPFVLMTATFSQTMLAQLADELGAVPFILTADELAQIPAQNKDRRFYVDKRPLAPPIIPHILQIHQTQTGQKRSLIILNQVKRAQELFLALQETVPEGTLVKLLHSRFRPEDRQAIETFARTEFRKLGIGEQYEHDSVIFVATQVVEVGLDITSQALHTELAPASSILQRAGRCARYAGEQGKVFVYDLPEKADTQGDLKKQYAPYHGTRAKYQCQQTWAWLQTHQDQHLTPTLEQALIDFAHTETDQQILHDLQASAEGLTETIQQVWAGNESDRVQQLVRQVRSQTIIVHPDPNNEAILQRPFQTESFSLYTGTLNGKWEAWQMLQADDFATEPIEWLAYKLVENPNADEDREAQGNRPPAYEWACVKSPHELLSPVLLINPQLVGYTAEVGFLLEQGDPFTCQPPPPLTQKAMPSGYSYKLETYEEHIRLVHKAFVQEAWPPLAPASHRLEQAMGWQAGLIADVAQLTVWAHDLGKLTQGWQGWAQAWQKAIHQPVPEYAVAHTHYRWDNPHHVKMNKKLRGKRPSHAVESAFLSLPYLIKALGSTHPLVKASFSAIARHHAPFSCEPSGFVPSPYYQEAVTKTWDYLPERWQEELTAVTSPSRFVANDHIKNQFQPYFVQRGQAEMLSYMLLVRALRQADQLGTAWGSN